MERQVYDRLELLQDEHWWFRSRREILASVLGRLRLPTAKPTILEAGCGTGGNLEMLSQFGQLKAFEHDVEALDMACDKGKYDVLQGTLPRAMPDYQDPFDLVAAFDVIEHVEEDLESLKTLRSKLKPDGKMVMTVPAFPFLWSAHDETHHHFRRYTRPELIKKLQEAGFEIEYISYFNSLLFPVIVGARVIKNLLGIKDIPDDGMPTRSINKILSLIFSSERHWLGRFSAPFGVSLIAIARNPS